MNQKDVVFVAGPNLYNVTYWMEGSSITFCRMVVAVDEKMARDVVGGRHVIDVELVETDISLAIPKEYIMVP